MSNNSLLAHKVAVVQIDRLTSALEQERLESRSLKTHLQELEWSLSEHLSTSQQQISSLSHYSFISHTLQKCIRSKDLFDFINNVNELIPDKLTKNIQFAIKLFEFWFILDSNHPGIESISNTEFNKRFAKSLNFDDKHGTYGLSFELESSELNTVGDIVTMTSTEGIWLVQTDKLEETKSWLRGYPDLMESLGCILSRMMLSHQAGLKHQEELVIKDFELSLLRTISTTYQTKRQDKWKIWTSLPSLFQAAIPDASFSLFVIDSKQRWLIKESREVINFNGPDGTMDASVPESLVFQAMSGTALVVCNDCSNNRRCHPIMDCGGDIGVQGLVTARVVGMGEGLLGGSLGSHNVEAVLVCRLRHRPVSASDQARLEGVVAAARPVLREWLLANQSELLDCSDGPSPPLHSYPLRQTSPSRTRPSVLTSTSSSRGGTPSSTPLHLPIGDLAPDGDSRFDSTQLAPTLHSLLQGTAVEDHDGSQVGRANARLLSSLCDYLSSAWTGLLLLDTQTTEEELTTAPASWTTRVTAVDMRGIPFDFPSDLRTTDRHPQSQTLNALTADDFIEALVRVGEGEGVGAYEIRVANDLALEGSSSPQPFLSSLPPQHRPSHSHLIALRCLSQLSPNRTVGIVILAGRSWLPYDTTDIEHLAASVHTLFRTICENHQKAVSLSSRDGVVRTLTGRSRELEGKLREQEVWWREQLEARERAEACMKEFRAGLSRLSESAPATFLLGMRSVVGEYFSKRRQADPAVAFWLTEHRCSRQWVMDLSGGWEGVGDADLAVLSQRQRVLVWEARGVHLHYRMHMLLEGPPREGLDLGFADWVLAVKDAFAQQKGVISGHTEITSIERSPYETAHIQPLLMTFEPGASELALQCVLGGGRLHDYLSESRHWGEIEEALLERFGYSMSQDSRPYVHFLPLMIRNSTVVDVTDSNGTVVKDVHIRDVLVNIPVDQNDSGSLTCAGQRFGEACWSLLEGRGRGRGIVRSRSNARLLPFVHAVDVALSAFCNDVIRLRVVVLLQAVDPIPDSLLVSIQAGLAGFLSPAVFTAPIVEHLSSFCDACMLLSQSQGRAATDFIGCERRATSDSARSLANAPVQQLRLLAMALTSLSDIEQVLAYEPQSEPQSRSLIGLVLSRVDLQSDGRGRPVNDTVATPWAPSRIRLGEGLLGNVAYSMPSFHKGVSGIGTSSDCLQVEELSTVGIKGLESESVCLVRICVYLPSLDKEDFSQQPGLRLGNSSDEDEGFVLHSVLLILFASPAVSLKTREKFDNSTRILRVRSLCELVLGPVCDLLRLKRQNDRSIQSIRESWSSVELKNDQNMQSICADVVEFYKSVKRLCGRFKVGEAITKDEYKRLEQQETVASLLERTRNVFVELLQSQEALLEQASSLTRRIEAVTEERNAVRKSLDEFTLQLHSRLWGQDDVLGHLGGPSFPTGSEDRDHPPLAREDVLQGVEFYQKCSRKLLALLCDLGLYREASDTLRAVTASTAGLKKSHVVVAWFVSGNDFRRLALDGVTSADMVDRVRSTRRILTVDGEVFIPVIANGYERVLSGPSTKSSLRQRGDILAVIQYRSAGPDTNTSAHWSALRGLYSLLGGMVDRCRKQFLVDSNDDSAVPGSITLGFQQLGRMMEAGEGWHSYCVQALSHLVRGDACVLMRGMGVGGGHDYEAMVAIAGWDRTENSRDVCRVSTKSRSLDEEVCKFPAREVFFGRSFVQRAWSCFEGTPLATDQDGRYMAVAPIYQPISRGSWEHIEGEATGRSVVGFLVIEKKRGMSETDLAVAEMVACLSGVCIRMTHQPLSKEDPASTEEAVAVSPLTPQSATAPPPPLAVVESQQVQEAARAVVECRSVCIQTDEPEISLPVDVVSELSPVTEKKFRPLSHKGVDDVRRVVESLHEFEGSCVERDSLFRCLLAIQVLDQLASITDKKSASKLVCSRLECGLFASRVEVVSVESGASSGERLSSSREIRDMAQLALSNKLILHTDYGMQTCSLVPIGRGHVFLIVFEDRESWSSFANETAGGVAWMEALSGEQFARVMARSMRRWLKLCAARLTVDEYPRKIALISEFAETVFQFVFILSETFRELPQIRKAEALCAHLNSAAASLRSGGLFVIINDFVFATLDHSWVSYTTKTDFGLDFALSPAGTSARFLESVVADRIVITEEGVWLHIEVQVEDFRALVLCVDFRTGVELFQEGDSRKILDLCLEQLRFGLQTSVVQMEDATAFKEMLASKQLQYEELKVQSAEVIQRCEQTQALWAQDKIHSHYDLIRFCFELLLVPNMSERPIGTGSVGVFDGMKRQLQLLADQFRRHDFVCGSVGFSCRSKLPGGAEGEGRSWLGGAVAPMDLLSIKVISEDPVRTGQSTIASELGEEDGQDMRVAVSCGYVDVKLKLRHRARSEGVSELKALMKVISRAVGWRCHELLEKAILIDTLDFARRSQTHESPTKRAVAEGFPPARSWGGTERTPRASSRPGDDFLSTVMPEYFPQSSPTPVTARAAAVRGEDSGTSEYKYQRT